MHVPLPGASGKTPRYLAIAAELAQAIESGQLAPGEKLPPHRVLAKQLGVTTGTVSRAYASLERQALATARVGDGTFVRNLDTSSEDASTMAAAHTIDLAHNIAMPTDETGALLRAMTALGEAPAQMARVLKYQPEAGATRHRTAGARWLQRFGTTGSWERVMVTHGAQHALAGVLRTIARPGDTLLTEPLSYPGMLALARSLRLQVVGLEVDTQGILPDALDRAAQTFNTKLLFCCPTLHNPTTSSMDMARREAIAAVIRKRRLLLMEDVVHAAAIRQPPPALATLVPEQSFLMASFSKVMAPGLRVGYLEAPPQWLDKVASSIRSDCWMVAPLMPEIATRWLDSGDAEHLIDLQRQRITERLAIARRVLSGISMRWAEDFPHVWLPLPAPWRAGPFAARLRRAGVLVRTMDHFAVGRSPVPDAVRISLNAPASIEQLRQGLQTVLATLKEVPSVVTDP
ncbi:MAG: PLP-dependent aminotransferase family protein [Rhodoferax sp.]|jgi:DNA-binding transcriptional MocR family regulator|nr:PLP-dependent aminotransferase family protein [Rhodoferax sp.]